MDSAIFSNIYNQIQMFWTPLVWACYLTGFILIIKAIYDIAAKTQRNDNSYGGCITIFIIGLFLANFTFILNVITLSVYGTTSDSFGVNSSGFRAGVSAPAAQVKSVLMFVVAAIKFIGFLGVWRGLMLLRDNGRQQGGSFSGGLVHIIGGILALNFELTVQIVAASVGGDFAGYISTYF